jgi:acyl-CoA synthetase (AMP-forming)/AMP-acid ligase II
VAGTAGRRCVTALVNELTYATLFDQAASTCTHEPAFVFGDQQRCLCDQLARVRRYTATLRDTVSIGPRTCFAVLSYNSLEYVTLWHVALQGWGIINPLNWRLAPAELAYILNNSGAEVVFVQAEFAPTVDAIRGDCPQVRFLSLDEPFGDVEVFDGASASSGHRAPERGEDDPCAVMYTGGTTGRPKGVVLSQRAIVLGLYRQAFTWDGFSRRDRYALVTPLFHASSFAPALLAPVARGGVAIYRTFDPSTLIADIARQSITALILVPTMISMLLDDPSYEPEKLRSLRLIGYGGSPISETLVSRATKELPWCDFVQIYGATEIGGHATVLSGEDHRRGGPRLRSAGRVLPGVRLSIRDVDDRECPTGELGEICIRAGSIMLGYHNAESHTAEALRDGWYRSGDVGYLDDQGYLFVLDRLKDMIVTGGENVYSAEVEQALHSHPGVHQAAVFGIPHPVWGEAVHAVVVPRTGIDLDPDEVLTHVRAQLAGYKAPKTIAIRHDPLPLSAANKVLKNQLRREMAGDQRRDDHP